MKRLLLILVTLAFASPTLAGAPEVVNVKTEQSGNTWTFHVTIRHADEGWDHYANGWGVNLEGGTELGYRTLHHPHVNEQPFTRSLAGVQLPEGVSQVVIRPRDSVHGEGADVVIELKP